MPFMQRAHGRDQRQRTLCLQGGNRFAQWIKPIDRLHP
jgi:hypothetical protein